MSELSSNPQSESYRNQLEAAKKDLLAKLDAASLEVVERFADSIDILDGMPLNKLSISFIDSDDDDFETEYLYQIQPLIEPGGYSAGVAHTIKTTRYSPPKELREVDVQTRRTVYKSITASADASGESEPSFDDNLLQSLQLESLPDEHQDSLWQTKETYLYLYSPMRAEFEKRHQSELLIDNQTAIEFSAHGIRSLSSNQLVTSTDLVDNSWQRREAELGDLELIEIEQLQETIDLILKHGQ